MNKKVSVEVLKGLLRRVDREEGAIQHHGELIRRRRTAGDPDAKVAAFILKKSDDLGSRYFAKWGEAIEKAACNLEAAGACDEAISLRTFRPIEIDAEPNDADESPLFDLGALRDCVVAMLGDLAEDRGTSVRNRTTLEEAEASAKRLFHKLWKLDNRTEWGRQIGEELGRGAVDPRTIEKTPSWKRAEIKRDRTAKIGQRLRAHGMNKKVIEQIEDPQGVTIDAIIQKLDDEERKKLKDDRELQELLRLQIEDGARDLQRPNA